MWILPKNYQLSSAFAADMVASKEDLTLPGLNIESSLMWRSKPSPLRTWLTRWKTGSYLPHLYTRILKPSHRKSFEEKLASSRAGIHVNLSQQQESASEKMTPDTSGPTYGDTLNQLDLLDASLKTSRDTSRLDSPQSSAIWKKMITEQRGEYSQRVKSALLTRESESSSWLTPVVQDSKHSGTNPGPNGKRDLLVNQVNWATPRTADASGGPRALNHKGQRITKSDPTKTYGANLSDQVRYWPTPSARDHKGGYQGGRIRNGKVSFDTLDVAVQHHSGDKAKVGHLNPNWVEWLMGVPTGWTGLGSWETE